jgi:hypothetical protein
MAFNKGVAAFGRKPDSKIFSRNLINLVAVSHGGISPGYIIHLKLICANSRRRYLFFEKISGVCGALPRRRYTIIQIPQPISAQLI